MIPAATLSAETFRKRQPSPLLPTLSADLTVSNVTAALSQPADAGINNGIVAGGGAICVDVATISRIVVSNAIAWEGSGGSILVLLNATITDATINNTAAGLVRRRPRPAFPRARTSAPYLCCCLADRAAERVAGSRLPHAQWGGAISFGTELNTDRESLASTETLQHTLQRVTVTNSEADMDGGVLYAKNGFFTITGLTVDSSASGYSGGALYIEESYVAMSKCSFSSTEAALAGGAVWIGGAVNVTDTTATDVAAGFEGGAFFLATTPLLKKLYGTTASLGPGLVITRAASAASGGAVYVNGPLASVQGATLSDSTAANSGGCVAAFSGLTLADSTFTRCGAGSAGGAVVIATTDPTLNTDVVGNLQVDEDVLDGWGADGAGARPSVSRAAIRNATFTNCSCVGSAPKGGAVAIFSVNVSVSASSFTGCAVTPKGLGQLCTNAAPQQVRSHLAVLQLSHAPCHLLPRHVLPHNHVTIHSVFYSSLSAPQPCDPYTDDFEPGSGGAVYAFQSRLAFNGVNLTSNTARGGGAVHASGNTSQLLLNESACTGNNATGGGAVQLIKGAKARAAAAALRLRCAAGHLCCLLPFAPPAGTLSVVALTTQGLLLVFPHLRAPSPTPPPTSTPRWTAASSPWTRSRPSRSSRPPS